MTLFEALTGGAFDRLNWQHSGEFKQNFSKKSNAPRFARGEMDGFGIDRHISFFFPGAGYRPAAQPPTGRTRGCSSSGLYPSTNPAWLDLPGTQSPTAQLWWSLRYTSSTTTRRCQPKVKNLYDWH